MRNLIRLKRYITLQCPTNKTANWFFCLGNWLFFYIRRKYSQFHENLLCAPKSSPLALNVESFVSRWSRDKTPSDKGNESDVTSTFYCFLTLLHIFLSLHSHPGGGGDSAYERGGDARRKFGIKPLKETDLEVAQAFFDP